MNFLGDSFKSHIKFDNKFDVLIKTNHKYKITDLTTTTTTKT